MMFPKPDKKKKKYQIVYSGRFHGTCSECKTDTICEWHHMIYGKGRRVLSDKYSLVTPLCVETATHKKHCHDDTHALHELSDKYKRLAQEKFEREHPELNFLEIFGRNYK